MRIVTVLALATAALLPVALLAPERVGARLERVEAAVAPSPAAFSTPAHPLPALPPMDYDAKLWAWDRKWHTSQWGGGGGRIPFRYDHVKVRGGDVVLRLDATGAPDIKAQNGTPWRQTGLWEVDVTLPRLKDGVIVAPLWLWNGDTKQEIDFELPGRGRGLDVTLHDGTGAKLGHKLFPGEDLSGRRMRLGIRKTPDRIDMMVDGQVAHSFERKPGVVFVEGPVKPVLCMWDADPNNGGFVSWAGRFQGFAKGEAMEMVIHGYRYAKL